MLRTSALFVLLALSSLAHAKDVSAKQVGVEYARQNLEKAESEHKDNLQRVADSERRLAEDQKRLAEDRKKAEESKKSLEENKAKYAKAQELLDQAWKQP
jgi:predicted Holliday junction resolvase-like endonuclease